MTRNELSTKILMALALAAAFVLTLHSAAPAQQRHHGEDDMAITAPAEVTEKAFSTGSAPLVAVDNVTGPIHVVGDSGSGVHMVAREILSGDSEEAIARARQDIHLDISQDAAGVKLYVDGPFRCGENPNMHCTHWSNPGYLVRYEFELHVPRGARLDLRTVNGGAINVEDVTGDFNVNNINGGVDLEEMAGSGRAYALNGAVKVSFRSNPARDSYFGSLNGSVNLFFQPGLAADLRYKTFNGQVYSDFDVAPAAAEAATAESRDGMRVFRSGTFTHGRVGAGGPVISLDGFHGNIYLHRR